MAKAKSITDLDIQAPVGKNARIIVQLRLEELYQWSKFVDEPYRVRELHDLRIAAKRLRYTLEVFKNYLSDFCKQAVKELTQLQDELGDLHDSDVMIALLRLCLGMQDSGTGYENALTSVKPQKVKGRLLLEPELVATVLDPEHPPSAEQRYGLERLLSNQEHLREQQYEAFRQHWSTLEQGNFQHRLLESLGAKAFATQI
ncbi:MAG TPA: CHAD domain-containing protein [Ktedonobacteraceae bacterium]|jgi:hypothetical protein